MDAKITALQTIKLNVSRIELTRAILEDGAVVNHLYIYNGDTGALTVLSVSERDTIGLLEADNAPAL